MGGSDGKYLGITRWRFYIKCSHCSRPITFLTDPKNADYEMESGGVRNYEIQKDKVATEEEVAAEHEKEEKEDPMKALENRVLESQREMADLDNLEEIKAMNARHVKLLSGRIKGDNNILGKAEPDTGSKVEVELTEEDEALVKSIKFGEAALNSEIKRLDEDDERQVEERRKRDVEALEERQRQLEATRPTNSYQTASTLPHLTIVKKRKRVIDAPSKCAVVQGPFAQTTTTVLAATAAQPSLGNGALADLLGGYSSDDSE
jgi:Saf4/Yju2 protein